MSLQDLGGALPGAARVERTRGPEALYADTRYYPLREDTAYWGASVTAGTSRT